MGAQCCISVVQKSQKDANTERRNISIQPKSPISPKTPPTGCRGSNDSSNIDQDVTQRTTMQSIKKTDHHHRSPIKCEDAFTTAKDENTITKSKDSDEEPRFAYGKISSLKKINDLNDYYHIGKTIGTGSYGQVVQAKHKKLELPCAIKIISKEKMSQSQMRKERMINELRILEKIVHGNIARIYELMHDSENFYIVSELIKSGDMAKLMSKRQKENRGLLRERTVKQIARQLFTALNYLHQQNITHRDIKLDNILYDEKSGHVKLIDFGFAQVVPNKKGFLTQRLGSTRYVAPEILFKRPYDTKVDVWSATIVIFILLTGKMPYNGKDFNQMKKLIERSDFDWESEKVAHLCPEAKSFLKAGLTKESKFRATCHELLNHPWLADVDEVKEPQFKTKKVSQSLFLVKAGKLISFENL